MKKLLFLILSVSFMFAYSTGYTVYPNLECDNFIVNTSISTNTLITNGFYQTVQKSVIDSSATTDAVLTPVGSFQLIDAHNDIAISTVNTVATLNISIGTEVAFITSLASQDIVFIETGNLALGSTHRTLANTDQVLRLLKTADDKWVEVGYFPN